MLARQEEYYQTIRIIHDSIRVSRSRMFHEITTVQPDSSELDKIAGQIGDYQKAYEEQTYKHLLILSEICTPEQRRKLTTVIKNTPYYRKTSKNSSHSNKSTK